MLSLLAVEVDLATAMVDSAVASAPGETIGDPKTRIADVTDAMVPHSQLRREKVHPLR